MTARNGAGRIRIIAGAWRGRKIPVPAAAGLRPTPDRVRETLFNWLREVTEGACCLDLFAGSGALGLEALSRGAAALTLVERHPEVCAQLREITAHIGAQGAEVVHSDALSFLSRPPRRYDVVFLDPPYDADLLEACCQHLEDGGWLAARAWIYLEHRDGEPPALPANWTLERSRLAGQVGYHLALRTAPAAAP